MNIIRYYRYIKMSYLNTHLALIYNFNVLFGILIIFAIYGSITLLSVLNLILLLFLDMIRIHVYYNESTIY